MTRSKLISAGLGACAIGWLVVSAVAFAGDEPGSRDHSLVGRYQCSSIVFYKSAVFDETALLQTKLNQSAGAKLAVDR